MKTCKLWAWVILAMLLLSACGREEPPAGSASVQYTEPAWPTTGTTEPGTTDPGTTEPEVTQPSHSELYIPGVSVEAVITYFTEVCLDGEIINSGDPSRVQKWVAPIYYTLEGDHTAEDVAALTAFTDWLNSVEGFPGIWQTEDPYQRNLRICFCDPQGMLELMGQNFSDSDGAVTFWYSSDEIYDAILCCRTDLDQELRNSVILEELYNGLGPVQDTTLRPDSIIYQEFSQPQWLTAVDELILQLLYSPEILPGMDAGQCEQVIRRLYF